MDVGEHIEALRREGELLTAAAERTDLDAPIPTCPGWSMRDLVCHIGDVHRWAAAHVAERRTEAIGREELTEIAGALPEDPALIEWFRQGHRRLVRTLESADPDTQCWSFLPAPSPVAFWARRQAHETGIHRADAESPRGSFTPFPGAFGEDGIDELLFGFLGRPPDEDGGEAPRTLALRATDGPGEWRVRIGAERVHPTKEGDGADCSVAGTASDLHLLLWNRRGADGLRVEGDGSLLTFWRDHVQITWSRPR